MRKWIIGVLVAAQALAVAPVFASTRGRQNTAAVLTGAALYSWLRDAHHHSTGRRNTALLLTAGSVYAWHNYNKSKKADRRRRERVAYYRGMAAARRRAASHRRVVRRHVRTYRKVARR
jgi:hypothetical protein